MTFEVNTNVFGTTTPNNKPQAADKHPESSVADKSSAPSNVDSTEIQKTANKQEKTPLPSAIKPEIINKALDSLNENINTLKGSKNAQEAAKNASEAKVAQDEVKNSLDDCKKKIIEDAKRYTKNEYHSQLESIKDPEELLLFIRKHCKDDDAKKMFEKNIDDYKELYLRASKALNRVGQSATEIKMRFSDDPTVQLLANQIVQNTRDFFAQNNDFKALDEFNATIDQIMSKMNEKDLNARINYCYNFNRGIREQLKDIYQKINDLNKDKTELKALDEKTKQINEANKEVFAKNGEIEARIATIDATLDKYQLQVKGLSQKMIIFSSKLNSFIGNASDKVNPANRDLYSKFIELKAICFTPGDNKIVDDESCYDQIPQEAFV
ncbi:MAG TPA: hypothetical protein DCS13_09490 [Candidatus Margulisbacteria bacterium]|nr:MAG: hypothetical protein A2X43_06215 [Candidatus Margulisbacteria bacterium GWD2_39_127]HAR63683.1 hypothetical protein [Candidatus Margulisiibacteriota bacterium]